MDQFEAEAGQRKEATEHGNAFFPFRCSTAPACVNLPADGFGIVSGAGPALQAQCQSGQGQHGVIPDAHHAVVAKTGAFRLRRGSRGSSRKPGWPVASPPRGEHSPFPGSATQPAIRKKWSSTVSDGDCPLFHLQRPGPGLDIDSPVARTKSHGRERSRWDH